MNFFTHVKSKFEASKATVTNILKMDSIKEKRREILLACQKKEIVEFEQKVRNIE